MYENCFPGISSHSGALSALFIDLVTRPLVSIPSAPYVAPKTSETCGVGNRFLEMYIREGHIELLVLATLQDPQFLCHFPLQKACPF